MVGICNGIALIDCIALLHCIYGSLLCSCWFVLTLKYSSTNVVQLINSTFVFLTPLSPRLRYLTPLTSHFHLQSPNSQKLDTIANLTSSHTHLTPHIPKVPPTDPVPARALLLFSPEQLDTKSVRTGGLPGNLAPWNPQVPKLRHHAR